MQRVLTTATLVGLLVATAAAFAITERLKLVKSPIYGTEITSVFSPATHQAGWIFRVGTGPGVLTNSVVVTGTASINGEHLTSGR